MTLVLTLLLGAAAFLQQPLDGVRVGSIDPLTGKPHTNFRQADFDGDGTMDLLFPSVREDQGPVVVVFQGERGFDPEKSAAVPVPHKGVAVDVWGDAVYGRWPGRLQVFQWREERWQTALEQDIAWPAGAFEEESLEWSAFSPAFQGTLTRFLHDLDADGTPEIIIPGPAGLYVYVKGAAGYEAAGPPLDVFPPMRLMGLPSQTLWPPAERHVTFPAREMFCRTLFEGHILTVIQREDTGTTTSYRVTRYPLSKTEEGVAIDTEGVRAERTPPLPSYMQPCRLNADETMDYAGGTWEFEQTSAIPMPVHTTSVTTRAGENLQHRRALFFRPNTLFVDFDGDGDLDLVTEETQLYDGGAREIIGRLLTARQVTHTVSVFAQGAHGVFADTPLVRRAFTVELPQPPFRNDPVFQDYQNGQSINCTGDFNADGYRDFVVRERPQALSIYLSHGQEYARQPDMNLDIADGHFGLADVDGDGHTDIVCSEPAGAEDDGVGKSKVYLFREDSP
jgi:hypothetical protein